jgi:hypothetical protein
MYQILQREPRGRILASKDIRMLVYSKNEIRDIHIYIDGKLHVSNTTYHGHGTPWNSFEDSYKSESPYLPLFKSPWDAAIFDDGETHTIKVVASDDKGLSTTVSHVFRVDDVKSEVFQDVGTFAEFVIQSNFPRYVLFPRFLIFLAYFKRCGWLGMH